jgi:AcrR family transcriptional regulator
MLLVAEQVFSKCGFKAATTRMIAKKAGVNISLIARYFDGKYGLLIKFVEQRVLGAHYTDLPYPPQENVTEECLKFARLRGERFLEDINMFKIVIVQFLTDAKFLKRFQQSLPLFESHPQFEERLQKLIDSKKMKSNIKPQQVLKTIEDYMFGLIISRALVHYKVDEDFQRDQEHFIRNYCFAMENVKD